MIPQSDTGAGAGAGPAAEARLLLRALEQLRAGRRREAAALCRRLLARDPAHQQALLLLGTLYAEDDDPGPAEALFSRALALGPGNFLALHHLAKLRQRRSDDTGAVALFEQALAARPDFAPAANDLGVSLHRLGRHQAALAAFDRALTVDPAYAVAHGNRGRVLMDARRPEEAAAAFRQEIAHAPCSGTAWHHLALAQDALDDLAAAETSLRQVLALEPAHVAAHFQLASVLDRRHRPAEATAYAVAGARRQGIVVKPCRGETPEARILVLGAAGAGNLPVRALFDERRFATIGAHLLPPGVGPAGPTELIERLPPFDIIFNAIADPDRGAGLLEEAQAVCHRLDRPLLNPPARVRRTRRDLGPSLFAGIPGLVVPATRRITRPELGERAATGDLDLPVLIRPCGSHGGTELFRLDQPGALAAYLDRTPVNEFYLTEYRDYRSADGYYRKYRLIFVDREVFPYHLAIGRDWMMHYWRANMAEAPWMKEEEAAFLGNYRSVFSGERGAAVEEVARRLDLDYGGLDCGITPEGEVLLFEANANMLVHLDEAREEFPYKHAHVPRIFEAMAALVRRRLA